MFSSSSQYSPPGTDSAVQLLCGVRNGEFVHISAVESGLKCGCVCPGCSTTLVAKKGDLNRHHFAHASGVSCQAAVESALHLAGKEVLSTQRRIVLLPVRVEFDGGKPSIEIAPQRQYACSDVRVERKLGSVVPDVLVTIDDWELAIEVFVTHRVDDQKARKYSELGLSALEIDLSNVGRELTIDVITRLVVEGGEHKRWIFNAFANDRKRAAMEQAVWLNTVSRGGPLHVDGCPTRARSFNGKPYANVIDDCMACSHSLDFSANFASVACDAHRSALLWRGDPVALDFCQDRRLTGRIDVDTVLKSADGVVHFEGYSYDRTARQTVLSTGVDEVVDVRTGEIRPLCDWLEVVRGNQE